MSGSIVNNAGTLDRAGFSFFNLSMGYGLPQPMGNPKAVYPFGLIAFVSIGSFLPPTDEPFSHFFFNRLRNLTGFFTTPYWPSVKSSMDWRGGRHALQ